MKQQVAIENISLPPHLSYGYVALLVFSDDVSALSFIGVYVLPNACNLMSLFVMI